MGEETAIFRLSIIRDLQQITVIRLDSTQRSSAAIYQDLRAEKRARSFQRLRQNIVPEIMKSSPTEVTNGEKKPLQMQQQFNYSECSCRNVNKSAKILSAALLRRT